MKNRPERAYFYKVRFITKFNGSKDLFEEFKKNVENLHLKSFVNFHKVIGYELVYKLNTILTTMQVHLVDCYDYKQYDNELIRLVDEDIINYGETLLEAFPELLI